MSAISQNVWYYRLLATLLNIILVVLAVLLHHAATEQQWTTAVLCAVSLILVGAADIYIKEAYDKSRARKQRDEYNVQRARQIKELKERYIQDLLKAAAETVYRAARPPRYHIRVNLMFRDESGNLVIRYEHGFAPEDKDRFIKVPTGTGCSGQAWTQKEGMAGNVNELIKEKIPHWGLPKQEIEKIRPTLQSIFTIPIISEANGEPIATFSVDSDNTIEEMKFEDIAIQQIVYCFAPILQDLLKEVD